jgi:hypothetical protein
MEQCGCMEDMEGVGDRVQIIFYGGGNARASIELESMERKKRQAQNMGNLLYIDFVYIVYFEYESRKKLNREHEESIITSRSAFDFCNSTY